MLSDYFKSIPPFFQLVLFFGFAMVSSALFVITGQLLGATVWGIDAFNAEALYDYSNPDAVSCLKMVTVFYQIGFFILPALIFARLYGRSRGEFLLLDRKPNLVNSIISVGAVLCTFLLVGWLVHLNQLIPLPGEFGESVKTAHEDSMALQAVMLEGNGIGHYAFTMLMLAVIPAIGEELMFRGLFIKLLARSTKNIHVAIWISAILFALIHLQFYHIIPIIFMGALFGYLLIWTGSIWVPIIAHFLNNTVTISLTQLINDGTIPENSGTFQSADYVALGVSGILFIVLMIVLWRNSRWREIKLTYLNQY